MLPAEAVTLCATLIITADRYPNRVREDFGGVLIAELEQIRTRIERGLCADRDLKRLNEIELALEKWPAEG